MAITLIVKITEAGCMSGTMYLRKYPSGRIGLVNHQSTPLDLFYACGNRADAIRPALEACETAQDMADVLVRTGCVFRQHVTAMPDVQVPDVQVTPRARRCR